MWLLVVDWLPSRGDAAVMPFGITSRMAAFGNNLITADIVNSAPTPDRAARNDGLNDRHQTQRQA